MPAREVRKAIRAILAEASLKERWNRYVYLTNDVTSASAQVMPFDAAALDGVSLPPNWNASVAEREYREVTAKHILQSRALYDTPAPRIVFLESVFLFTGRFIFGSRAECENAVVIRGGVVPDLDDVSHVVDYLVVGACGGDWWKNGMYGAKLEAAVVERQLHQRPAIIAETHWCRWLKMNAG